MLNEPADDSLEGAFTETRQLPGITSSDQALQRMFDLMVLEDRRNDGTVGRKTY